MRDKKLLTHGPGYDRLIRTFLAIKLVSLTFAKEKDKNRRERTRSLLHFL
jgi:hypothetical protein